MTREDLKERKRTLFRYLKGQCHRFFFVTLNSQKTYLNPWNRQNNGSVLLTIILIMHRD